MDNNFTCPVCNSLNVSLLYEEPFLDIEKYPQQVYKCAECKVGISYPILTDEEVKGLYNESYSQNPFYKSEDKCSVPFHYRIYCRIFDYLGLMGMNFPVFFEKCYPYGLKNAKNARILDFGSGCWDFVNFLRSKNFNVYGYDINPKFREIGEYENKFFDVENCNNTNQFDVVRMYHVLEHSAQPENMLKKINALLKPDGQLCIAVPNFSSCLNHPGKNGGWFHLPYHRYLFSKEAITLLLNKTGFKIKKIQTRSIGMGYLSHVVNGYRDNLLNQVLFKIKSLIADISGQGDAIEILAIKENKLP